ncbi:MAG: hypothetical protein UHM85_02960 [Acutalibacteraceae bacterium]|nr:hypothetical protein [Acutalibacteraceae bacterium]
MKTKLIIFLVLIILIVLSAFAVKRYIDNSVVDKHGMIRGDEKTTVICGDTTTK